MVTNPQDDAATLAMLKHHNPDHDRIWRAWDDLGRKGNRNGDGAVRLLDAPDGARGCRMNIPSDTIVTAAEIGCAVGAVLATFILIMLAVGLI